MVETKKIKVQTKGDCDIVDTAEQVSEAVVQSGIIAGAIILFNGSVEHGQ